MAKYNNIIYKRVIFCGGSDIIFHLKACKDNIVLMVMLQIYVLHWYHAYLLHPGLDKMDAIIRKYLYWPEIKKYFRLEVSNGDTCQRTKIKNMVN